MEVGGGWACLISGSQFFYGQEGGDSRVIARKYGRNHSGVLYDWCSLTVSEFSWSHVAEISMSKTSSRQNLNVKGTDMTVPFVLQD